MDPMDMENMTEEQMQWLLESFGEQEKQKELEQRIAQARALRGGAGPEGRQAGGVYVAANPLEHIGAAMQNWQRERELTGGGMIGKAIDKWKAKRDPTYKAPVSLEQQLRDVNAGLGQRAVDYGKGVFGRKPQPQPDPFDSYSKLDY